MALTAQQQQTLFSDEKLNKMRQAAVAGDWNRLFQIAPRGCNHPDGVMMPADLGPGNKTWTPDVTGVCGDAPNVVPGSPEGKAMYAYWAGTNPLRKAITLQDLRYKKDANGRIVHVPMTRAHAEDFYFNHQWAYHNFGCKDDKLRKWIGRASQGGAIETWGQCREHGGAKRWNKVKNVAAAAVAVTGAVFLGPAIGAAAKAGASAIGAAASKVGALATKAIGAVNAGRTIEAIKNGEVPPPPIDVKGKEFTEWAMELGVQEFMESEKRKMTRQEEQLLQAEILAMQTQLAQSVPRNVPKSPSPQVPAVVQEKSAELAVQQKQTHDTLLTAAALALPAILLLKG